MGLRATYTVQKWYYVSFVVLLLILGATARKNHRQPSRHKLREPPHDDFLTNNQELNIESNQGCLWGEWENWSKCSQKCGSGNRKRERFCYCQGTKSDDTTLCPTENSEEISTCNTQDCCKWGSYSKWGNCTKTCGGGKKIKTQLCECPSYAIKYGFNTKNGCAGFPLTMEKSCNEKNCCEWEFSSWSECDSYCGKETRYRNQTCVCTPGGTQTGCLGGPTSEEVLCKEKFDCPHEITYWISKLNEKGKSWPLPISKTFSCKSESPLGDKTWKEIISSKDTSLWYQLAKLFIATELSLVDGSYSTKSLEDAMSESEEILMQCGDIGESQRAYQLTLFLQNYLDGKLDPRSKLSLEDHMNSFNFSLGSLSSTKNVKGKLEHKERLTFGSEETKEKSDLVSLFIVAPTVTICAVIAVIVLAVYVVRSRIAKRSDATSLEISELQYQLDRGNQEESGEDLDVDELEELKL